MAITYIKHLCSFIGIKQNQISLSLLYSLYLFLLLLLSFRLSLSMIALIFFILYWSSHLHNTHVCICSRLVTRFCGGPVDSGSRPCSPLNGEMVVARWLLLVVACPIFVLVARCNVGFVLAALTHTPNIDRIHK